MYGANRMTPDDQFETFLRDFEPRRPRALPLPQTTCPYWLNRLAAAAVLVFALTTSSWFSFRSYHQTSSQLAVNNSSLRSAQATPAPFALTREILENPDHLDALLEAIPNHQLPRFDQQNSALCVLAAE